MAIDRNSVPALRAWAHKALLEANLPEDVQEKLYKAALEEIEKGGWRGDISSRWRKEGYTGADIPDFYP